MKTHSTILSLLLCSTFGWAEEDGFSRYQPILERQPFGQEPPEADMTQVASSESFARNLRLSMIFEAADGTLRAGIIDTSTGKSYTLQIGEVQGGYEMVEGDFKASQVLIKKNQEVALFRLQSAANDSSVQTERPVIDSRYSERRRRHIQALESRNQQLQAPPSPDPQLQGEALKKHLENVQMDAIRNGLPPLPIPLTPEMDAKLVEEGVLPPQ